MGSNERERERERESPLTALMADADLNTWQKSNICPNCFNSSAL